MITQLINFCVLADDQDEPHRENQKLLIQAGLLSDGLDLLKKPDDSGIPEESMILMNIRRLCFKLLTVLSKEQAQVKRDLFDYLDEFLSIKGAEKELGIVLSFFEISAKPTNNNNNNKKLFCFPY